MMVVHILMSIDNYGGYISGVIKKLIPFIDYQVGLETLIVEGLLNNFYRIEDCDDE